MEAMIVLVSWKTGKRPIIPIRPRNPLCTYTDEKFSQKVFLLDYIFSFPQEN
jgi:hypothetical protein